MEVIITTKERNTTQLLNKANANKTIEFSGTSLQKHATKLQRTNHVEIISEGKKSNVNRGEKLVSRAVGKTSPKSSK